MPNLVAQPHPFIARDRITATFAPGLTIGELLDEIDWPLRLDQFTRITVDGVEILRPDWDERRLNDGERVIAVVVPQGGKGGGAKQIIGLVAMIAIAIAAPYLAGPAMMGFVGTEATIVAAGITLVGSLAVGALLRPPGGALASLPGGGDASSALPQYTMQGQSNIATPYGVVPRIYGRQRVKPRIAAEPFTVNLYGDNFLFVIYDFGYGPLAIEDVRIGETPVAQFQGAAFVVHENFTAGSALQLYTNDSHSEAVQVDMRDATMPALFRELPAEAGALVLEVNAPQGLYYQQTNGEASGLGNEFVVYINGVMTAPSAGYTNRDNTRAYNDGGHSILYGGQGQPTHRNPFSASFFYSLPAYTGSPWSLTIQPSGFVTGDVQAVNAMWLTAIRTYSSSKPIAPLVGHTIIELRVRASGQLSGMIDSFSAIATSKLPIWNGSAWSAPTPTRNPAWIYADILRGSANNRPVPDSRIDLSTLLSWANECATPPPNDPGGNFTCDVVFDQQTTVRDAIQIVASTGRAAPSMRDLKTSVIRESAVPAPVQLITSRNSWNFSASMPYLDPPHALKIQYLSDVTWNQEEIVVYDDGYDANNATMFESLSLIGTVRSRQAWRLGRYYLAAGILRRERGSVSMDVENLIAQRGDMIAVAHDVMKVGGPAARVVTVNAGEITLDSDLVTANVTGIRVRKTDNGLLAPMPVLGVVDVRTLSLSVPNAALIAVGDLIVYGVISQITGDYIVEGIDPGADLTATVRFIEHRPAILNADTGAIPDRIPKPGTAPDGTLAVVTALTCDVTRIIVDGHALYEFSLHWSQSILASRYNILLKESDGTWAQVGETGETRYVDRKGWQQVVAGTREYGVMPMGRLGATGKIASVGVTVNPSTDKWPAPPQVGNLRATPRARDVLIEWIRPSYDFAAGYVVRLGSWDAPREEFMVDADNISLRPQLVGTHSVFVATIDRTGTLSEPVAATFTILAPAKVRLTGTAIVNTAVLKWADPVPRTGIWAGQTTHAIEFYEIVKEEPVVELSAYRGRAIRKAPRQFAVACERMSLRASPRIPGEQIPVGSISTEYVLLEEQQAGLWRYSVRAVDVAGNRGPFASVDLTLVPSDNYFALDFDDDILPDSTLVNFKPEPLAGGYVAPFDMAISYEQHFIQGGWSTPLHLIIAGMPYWSQPPASAAAAMTITTEAGEAITTEGGEALTTETLSAGATMDWQWDYTNEVPAVRITVTPIYTVIAGSPEIDLRYHTRALSTDPWVDQGVPNGDMIPPDQTQIRVTMGVNPGPDGKGFAVFHRVEYRLDVQYIVEDGEVLLDATGIETVTFFADYADVRSVHLTSGDPDIDRLYYLLAPDQQSMTITAIDDTGAPQAGLVSWAVRGF